jgi:hypothetical protein
VNAIVKRINRVATAAAGVAVVAGAVFGPGYLLGGQATDNTSVRVEGPAIRIGNGQARTYVLFDPADDRTPREIGVAIDAAGLEGLPTSGMSMNRLRLPANAPAPYTFVMFDWNAMGHEPAGIYDQPHFDFHFYLTPEADVDRIIPTSATFAQEANSLPTGDFLPPMFAALAPPGMEPAAVAVPQMGLHWSDVRSPELQAMLGKPEAYEPFAKTFIYGSWNGEFTFLEPMITRAHLLTQPDEIIPVPQPAKYGVAGWYPTAYRVTFDRPANEYRVALTGLTWREAAE